MNQNTTTYGTAQHATKSLFVHEQDGKDITGLTPSRTRTQYRIPAFRLSLVRESTETADKKCITGPRDCFEILRSYLEGSYREHFVIFMLDTKNRIIGLNTVSVGDMSSSICHPRETFKAAIIAGAASIILGHNHPSGDPTPSADDVGVTKRLMQAGEILGIDVLDHIVIGDGVFVSLKERGLV